MAKRKTKAVAKISMSAPSLQIIDRTEEGKDIISEGMTSNDGKLHKLLSELVENFTKDVHTAAEEHGTKLKVSVVFELEP